MLVLAIFLFLEFINATEYSVTIMNDSKLGDKQGAVHTWLTFDSPNGGTKYFSFETLKLGNVATGVDAPGSCTKKNHIENRSPSESARIFITEEKYQKFIDSSLTFCANPPAYDLIPNNFEDNLDIKFEDRTLRNDFNCVTAANKILQVANIDTLSNAMTPYDVKQIITNKRSLLKKLGVAVVEFIRRFPYIASEPSSDPNAWQLIAETERLKGL